jgi:predicted esterase
VLLLHGTGGDENDLIQIGQTIAPGAAFLSPRGQVLERGMPRFFRRLAEGVFDIEDLHLRTEQLAHWIGESAARYNFDPTRVSTIGYSNGANIAASVLLSHPQAIANAILLRAMLPFEPETLPDLRGKRIFMSNGAHDPIIPQPSSARLAEIFRKSSADVTGHVENAGHGLSQRDIDLARDFYLTLP